MNPAKYEKFKTVLGIESSCDETGACVATIDKGKVTILSNVVSSSLLLQSKYGGVIPEFAAREQLKSIIPVLSETISNARLSINDIDAIAVTQGPGLIGSLLVGVETAKALSLAWNKPLISVNHLTAHFYANWLISPDSSLIQDVPYFPSIGLLVSGGHTDLILIKDHGVYEYLGGTRDDAAGEAFDKTARLLGLPYPGGPNLSTLAQKGNSEAYKLPRPMIDSNDFDFSFSGLKTHVLYTIQRLGNKLSDQQKADLAAGIEEAIVDILVKKTIKAANTYNIEQIIVAGGVAANKRLRERLKTEFKGKLHIPTPSFCTDNAAMVTAAAFFTPNIADPSVIQAKPNLSL